MTAPAFMRPKWGPESEPEPDPFIALNEKHWTGETLDAKDRISAQRLIQKVLRAPKHPLYSDRRFVMGAYWSAVYLTNIGSRWLAENKQAQVRAEEQGVDDFDLDKFIPPHNSRHVWYLLLESARTLQLVFQNRLMLEQLSELAAEVKEQYGSWL